ncbi:MAG: NOB1 family endonuclease [Thermoproteota archaeon]|nr:NOB1 family endonuclease [Thermoproteota archaeon]
MRTTENKTIILDTSAFIAGFDPFSIKNEQYSVPLVKQELTSTSLSWTRFKTAVENGRIKIRTPNTEFVRKVQEASKTVGNSFFLSEADRQVLALALQLKDEKRFPLIVTDDYSIQNVADQIGVEFAPLMTFGIRFRLNWIRYCPACFRKYPPDYPHKRCEVCGTKLKRKPLSKKPLKEK